MRRTTCVMGEVYHVCNRGVEGRDIFCDSSDYVRFIHYLFEFNDHLTIHNIRRSLEKSAMFSSRNRTLLVEVLAFSLLPNHFHLLLRPRVDKIIPLFMKRICAGYANYFNKRYERSGTLFQGRYRGVHIERSEQFEYIPYYVHANALDLIYPEWREGKLQDAEVAMRFLENYRWSSFPDYIGKKNFPSVTQREFLQERLIGGPSEYERGFMQWLRDFQNYDERIREFLPIN